MFTIRNSFKQLLRKPVKALLFFCLMAAAAMLLVFGGAMYAQSAGRIEAANKLLNTVAFIGQKPLSDNDDAIDTEYGGEYLSAKYGDIISLEDLDFPGADYIVPPRTMPFYTAYNPDYVTAANLSWINETSNWMHYIEDNEPESIEMSWHTFTVVAPERLDMLFSSSQNNLRVRHGRNITAEEFESGAKVCLVSKSFMQRNLVYEGDMIGIPLICTSYNEPFPHTLRDEDGEAFQPFYIGEYELVGVFEEGKGSRDISYSNAVIIPKNSMDVPDGNIVEQGPMKQWTTCCQLQNGGAERFLQALKEALGEDAERLEITYNDNGFADLMESMESAQRTAFLLLAVGALASAAIIALLMYFFVIRERKRTAVERSLGLTGRQCRMSILAGLMALTVAATAVGSLCGGLLLSQADAFGQLVAQQEEEEEAAVKPIVDWSMGGIFNFSSKYSMWPDRRGVKANLNQLQDIEPPGEVFWIAPAAMCIVVLLLSVMLVNRNLRIEPILLLSVKA